jgi:hypothetical protein
VCQGVSNAGLQAFLPVTRADILNQSSLSLPAKKKKKKAKDKTNLWHCGEMREVQNK